MVGVTLEVLEVLKEPFQVEVTLAAEGIPGIPKVLKEPP